MPGTVVQLGELPWQDEDDRWHSDSCPWPELVESLMTLDYAEDWPHAHPVSTGRAPWLPAPYVQAMHTSRAEVAEQRALMQERANAKRGAR